MIVVFRSSPEYRVFDVLGVSEVLDAATREYVENYVNLAFENDGLSCTSSLPRQCQWYLADFSGRTGEPEDLLIKLMQYFTPVDKERLEALLANKNGRVWIRFWDYSWDVVAKITRSSAVGQQ